MTNNSSMVVPMSNERIIDFAVFPTITPSDCFLFLLTMTAHPSSGSTRETANPLARLKRKIFSPLGKITSFSSKTPPTFGEIQMQLSNLKLADEGFSNLRLILMILLKGRVRKATDPRIPRISSCFFAS